MEQSVIIRKGPKSSEIALSSPKNAIVCNSPKESVAAWHSP